MNSRVANTLQFQRLPISLDALALAASSRLQRLSASYWIDNLASVLYLPTTISSQMCSRKLLQLHSRTASRFLRDNVCPARQLIPSLISLAHFRLRIYKQIPGLAKH